MSNYTDANLITTTAVNKARAIKIGNKIFTGFAEGGSSSANFDLAKVTAYEAGHEAYTAITQIVVSGFSTFSSCNGTFTPTDATSSKQGVLRIYTNGSIYLQYVYRDSTLSYYWMFANSITTEYWDHICCYSVNAGTDVPTGTNNWYSNNSGDSLDGTLTATTTTVPAVAESTTVAKVTAYNSTTDYFDVLSTTSAITAYQVTPVVTGIYCRVGTLLIGNMIRKYPNSFSWITTTELACTLGEVNTADTTLLQRGSYQMKKYNSDFAIVASVLNSLDEYSYDAWANVVLVSLTEDGAKKYRTLDGSTLLHVFAVTSMVYKGTTYYYTQDPGDYSINSEGYPRTYYTNYSKEKSAQALVKRMIDDWKYGTAKMYVYNMLQS